MGRATTGGVILLVSMFAVFAQAQRGHQPVEAPVAESFPANSSGEALVAQSDERTESIQPRLEAAVRRAQAEAERRRHEEAARIEAMYKQRARQVEEALRDQELWGDLERARRELRERVERLHDELERLKRKKNHDDASIAAAGATTHTIPVADLLTARPGRRNARFDSPKNLIAVLKEITGAENWDPEGGMMINRRTRVLTVLHRAEMVEKVQRQLNANRRRGPGSLTITLRILLVPDDAEIGLVDNRAAVISHEQRARIYKKYQGQVDGAKRRDYERQYTVCNGDLLHVWTADKMEIDAAHRGVSVVCRIHHEQQNAARILPIPFAGDEEKVDWQPLTVGLGQSAVYDLPSVRLPQGGRDAVRALAFATVDAISPGAEN